jgi:thiol-disulfide isomerase/thioredoxin
MLRPQSSALLALAILPLALPSAASQIPLAIASGATVRDIDGHRHNLFDQDMKATVLIFVTSDCPVTNSYIPEINRIAADYEARKFAFYAVYTDPTVSIPATRMHAREFGLHIPLIRDTAHYLVRGVGATVTPEVAVLQPGGKLVYLGPIDDLYVDFGKRRPAPTQWYLRQALDAVLSGKPVAIPSVKPIGCFIPAEP